MDITIREIHENDAAAISQLSLQLGYTLSPFETVNQIKEIAASGDNCAFVALYNKKIIGWIHAFKAMRLETKTFIEIGGLVVYESYRGKGVGKALVERIKAWCVEQKIAALRVRSNTKRSDAHMFYLKNGFTESKEQKVFGMKVTLVSK